MHVMTAKAIKNQTDAGRIKKMAEISTRVGLLQEAELSRKLQVKSEMYVAMKAKHDHLKSDIETLKKKHFEELSSVTRARNSAEALIVSMQARVDWTTQCLQTKQDVPSLPTLDRPSTARERRKPAVPPRRAAPVGNQQRMGPSPRPPPQRPSSRAAPSAKDLFCRAGARGSRDSQVREARRLAAEMVEQSDMSSATAVLAAIGPVRRLLSLQFNPVDQFAKVVLQELRSLIPCGGAVMSLVDFHARNVLATLDSQDQPLQLSMDCSLAGHVALNHEVANLRDTYSDYRFHPELDRMTSQNTTTALAVPVCDSFGSLVAVLELHNSKNGHGFSRQEENLLQIVAEVVGGLMGHELLQERELGRWRQKERVQNLCEQLHEQCELPVAEQMIVDAASQILPSGTCRLLWLDHGSDTMSSSISGGFTASLSQSVEGTALGKRVVTYDHPQTHPLYNSSIDDHFGSQPDQLLVVPISGVSPAEPQQTSEVLTRRQRSTRFPLALLVLGDPVSGQFSTQHTDQMLAFCQQIGSPTAQLLLKHRLDLFGSYISHLEPSTTKVSQIIQRICQDGPSLLNTKELFVYAVDQPSQSLWTIKPGSSQKTYVPLTDPDAQAALAANGPIAFEVPAAKSEEKQLTVYAAIKDHKSDQMLGLLHLKGYPGQGFSDAELLLVKLLLKQLEQLLRDATDLQRSSKELKAHVVESQFLKTAMVDFGNNQLGSTLVMHIARLIENSTCQMLSCNENNEDFADVVTGKHFTIGGQAKLAMHARKSHVVQLDGFAKVITPVFNSRNQAIFLILTSAPKVTDRAIAQLDHMAQCLTTVMENVHKFRRKNLLVAVGQQLHADLTTTIVTTKIIERACEFTHGEEARLFAVDSASEEIKLLHSEPGGAALTLAKGEGIVGYCAMHGQPINVPDVYKDPNFSAPIDLIPQMYCKTTCCVPLQFDGDTVGVIQVLKRTGFFTDDDVLHLKDLALVSALALSNCILVEANKSDTHGALTMLIDPQGSVLQVNRDPSTVIGVSRPALLSKPLRVSLSANPDVIENVEKTQKNRSPLAVVNSAFWIGNNRHSMDYTMLPYEGANRGVGYTWLVVSRVTPIRPDMQVASGAAAMQGLQALTLKGVENKTVVFRGVAVVIHFFIRPEDCKLASEADPANLEPTIEEYLPACMDVLAQCSLLGVLERFEKNTMTFTFGIPRPADDDIAQGCDFAFKLRDGLAGINKQRAILNLPNITTCAMIQTGDLESSPERWTDGMLSYDWLDKSITDLLPVALHYGVQGVLVADETLASVGKGCVSREIDNVFLPFTGLHCCVHEVISRSQETAPAGLLRNLSLYSDGLAAYRARRWITAIEFFQQLTHLCNDRPSATMIQHCHHWIKRDVGSYWDTSWEIFDEEDESNRSPALTRTNSSTEAQRPGL